MDGGGRTHFRALTQANDSLKAISQHRCGRCGLLPSSDDQALDRGRELCGASLAILTDVEWRYLLNENASAIAK